MHPSQLWTSRCAWITATPVVVLLVVSIVNAKNLEVQSAIHELNGYERTRMAILWKSRKVNQIHFNLSKLTSSSAFTSHWNPSLKPSLAATATPLTGRRRASCCGHCRHYHLSVPRRFNAALTPVRKSSNNILLSLSKHLKVSNKALAFVNMWNCFNFCLQRQRRPSSAPPFITVGTIDNGTHCEACYNNKTGQCQPKYITRISYMTDVEGDGAYFDRFINISKILQFSSSSGQQKRQHNDANQSKSRQKTEWNYRTYAKEVDFIPINQIRQDEGMEGTYRNNNVSIINNTMFVFGGDIWDKGDYDLYVLRQLLSLRRRYSNNNNIYNGTLEAATRTVTAAAEQGQLHQRVNFIMGNRDINKIRISQELGVLDADNDVYNGANKSTSNDVVKHAKYRNRGEENDASSKPAVLPRLNGVYWLRGTGKKGGPDAAATNPKLRAPQNSPSKRLQWMLKSTMGSPHAFEFRRKELARERKEWQGDTDAVAVTDEDVVKSYKVTCSPKGGIMSEYLRCAELVTKIGSALFMHGALPLPDVDSNVLLGDNPSKRKSNLLWRSVHLATPWIKNAKNAKEKRATNPLDWINSLNNFAATQVRAWSKLTNKAILRGGVWSSVGGYHNTTAGGIAGGGLLQYGMGWLPNKQKNPTVVYSTWLNDNEPSFVVEGSVDHDFAKTIWDFFKAANISLCVTGHKPHGDVPLPIRVPKKKEICGGASDAWILTGDTSYSGDTIWVDEQRNNKGRGSSPTGRGDVAVSEILIDLCSQCGRVASARSHGVMSDGSTYESVNLVDDKESAFIGKPMDNNRLSVSEENGNDSMFWVKAKLDNETYLVSTARKYDVWNSVASVATKAQSSAKSKASFGTLNPQPDQ